MKYSKLGLFSFILVCMFLTSGCRTSPVINSSTPSSIVGTQGIPGIRVVSVSEIQSLPGETIIPGGGMVEIVVKNISSQIIVSLVVMFYEPLEANSPWSFNFEVSPLKPLSPNLTISKQNFLIGSGWGPQEAYFLTVSGAYDDGSIFAFRWEP
jgi:hypothetical protein